MLLRITAEIKNRETGEVSRALLVGPFRLQSTGITIGRSQENMITLNSDHVSSFHARLIKRHHHFFVEVIEGHVHCANNESSEPGASWRVSGIGNPQPLTIGPFTVSIELHWSEGPCECESR